MKSQSHHFIRQCHVKKNDSSLEVNLQIQYNSNKTIKIFRTNILVVKLVYSSINARISQETWKINNTVKL